MEGCNMWGVYEVRVQDLFSRISLQFYPCFRNPGGDYAWADSDKPPPKYWVKKMAALFGYSDEHEKLMEQDALSALKNSSKKQKADSDRYRSRRSREIGEFNNSGSGRRRKHRNERNQSRTPNEEIYEQNINLKLP
ncbi:zinc finger CCCH domain-containing protein 5-like [Prosopis cineraria]|uniref:zinc finger CCCH domain-containing protein 5-like n=1 Tax=Prosopis cineraria TaxID=364024 RepID=UPI00240F4D03|nr:zinc finger CCCH domain-containing protein 5-like [Prosopis cineraria]